MLAKKWHRALFRPDAASSLRSTIGGLSSGGFAPLYSKAASSALTPYDSLEAVRSEPRLNPLYNALFQIAQGYAMFHDALIHSNRDIPKATNRFILNALSSLSPHVNSNPEKLLDLIREGFYHRELLQATFGEIMVETLPCPAGIAEWVPMTLSESDIIQAGQVLSDARRSNGVAGDEQLLAEFMTVGLRGLSEMHLETLNLLESVEYRATEETEVFDFVAEAISHVASQELDVATILSFLHITGQTVANSLSELSSLETKAFGTKQTVRVRTSPVAGTGMLVAGTTTSDLEVLLHYAKRHNVNVYTYGDLIEAHKYSRLRSAKNLVGHYGRSAEHQQEDFENFPGSIIVASGMLLPVRKSYANRLFSMSNFSAQGANDVGGTSTTHLEDISTRAGLDSCFGEDADEARVEVVHYDVGEVAAQLADGVVSGSIRHVFLLGGSNGARLENDYVLQFVNQAHDDSVFITFGSAKHALGNLVKPETCGTINGGALPRIIDLGPLEKTVDALQLVREFEKQMILRTRSDRVPLSTLYWLSCQKSCACLLALLADGVRNIYVGPELSPFMSDSVQTYFSDAYKLYPISTPENDIKKMSTLTISD
ncbi:hypothetical protein NDN08_001229 [Rhodosorus marinus]|uniref:Uncharacterized protein n=1 Tax=Rhodosorus marinus TaxID=101924 RepID=A0AAV8UT84_9RHOD|nr:hypothetical protein NDN08_001229 [Rhodosorus marinus]